jgi:DNA-binding transcriptional LysR family regulator
MALLQLRSWLRSALRHSVAFGFVIKALARFKSRYPSITVRLIESNNLSLIDRVLHREVDFAIGTIPVPHRELAFRKLLQDEVRVVYPSSHSLAGKRKITWRDIASEPIVLAPKGSSARELAERGFAASQITCDAHYEVVNMVTALSMVRARLAVTIMSRIALGELNMKGLRSARISDPRPGAHYWHYHADRSPAVYGCSNVC